MEYIPLETKQVLLRALRVLAVLVLGGLWSAAPALAEETRAYTVQPGDTLYRLSQRFGTTVEALVALNDIRDPDLILVGQVLLVPETGLPAAGVPAGPATSSEQGSRVTRYPPGRKGSCSSTSPASATADTVTHSATSAAPT